MYTTVEQLVDDSTIDDRFINLKVSDEARLLHELSNAHRLARQLQATSHGLEEFSRELVIPLTSAAWYSIPNCERIVHAEIRDTWESVDPCGVWDRARGWRGTYPSGQNVRVHFVPRYPDLIQGQATGGSTTTITLPLNNEDNMTCGVIDNRDDIYIGTVLYMISGSGAGDLFLGTDYDGSNGQLTGTLLDGTSPSVAYDSTTVFCTYLGDLDSLILPIIKDYALTVMTGNQKAADTLESKYRSMLSVLGLSKDIGIESSEDRGEQSGLYYRFNAGRIQFLGRYGSDLGFPWSGL